MFVNAFVAAGAHFVEPAAAPQVKSNTASERPAPALTVPAPGPSQKLKATFRPSGAKAGVTALVTTPVSPLVGVTSLPSSRAKSFASVWVYASRAKRELASANDPSGYGADQTNLRLFAAIPPTPVVG